MLMYFKFRTLSSIVIFTLLITSVYATSNPLQAFATTQTLYGATGGGLSDLYKINPDNGEAIHIDVIKNGDNQIGVSGLGFSGGVLYGAGQTAGSVTASMETIDPSTGAVISLFTTSPKCADISFAPSGTLYCISPGAQTLYTLDKTIGSSLKVGDTGITTVTSRGKGGGAIAVNPTSGNSIFVGANTGLFTLSPDTGAETSGIPWVLPSDWSTDINCRPSAFAFDNAGTLYASFICESATFLTTVNTDNAEVTQIGQPTVTSLDALAFAPLVTPPSIPEFPFSFSLVIMFVVVAAVYMGMRQKITFGKPRL